jgi:hypothetical protein
MRSILILSCHICLGFLTGHRPFVVVVVILYIFVIAPMHAACSANLILPDFVILMFVEECNFLLHTP